MTACQRSDSVVVVIGIFKLIKAALLIWLGIVSLRFAGLVSIPHNPLRIVGEVTASLGALPGRHALLRAVHRMWAIDAHKAEWLGLGSFTYAVVFLVEGLGLTLRKRWAEWLTIVVTASFIPFEIYELVERFGIGKIVAIALNVAILAYLLLRKGRTVSATRVVANAS